MSKYEADEHWEEVMKLAEKYGFIIKAYGGTATLATHENQINHLGEGAYIQIQRGQGRIPEKIISEV